MTLELQRLFESEGALLGVLLQDSMALAFTLEPAARHIPAGVFELALRQSGELYTRYHLLYPWIAPGMLELIDVPGFTDILIHPGNGVADTSGCVLVGDLANARLGQLTQSSAALRRVYLPLATLIRNNATVGIVIHEREQTRGQPVT
jgi:hypothetical protein